ncbi:hypothetical protein [Legionella rowbothamii]|nr:hypothetical protein [Legionella rowbothamii]
MPSQNTSLFALDKTTLLPCLPNQAQLFNDLTRITTEHAQNLGFWAEKN